MRCAIRIFLLTVFALVSPAGATALEEGNAAFAKGDYDLAIRSYETALSSGSKSAGLYYNLGMAQMKDSQFPQAAMNFRRALILDPRFVDARIALTNLERAQGLTVPLPDWRQQLAERVPLAALYVVGSALVWVGAFLLLFAIFKKGRRVLAVFASFLLLVAGGGLFSAAYLSDPRIAEKNSGIVTDKEGATLLSAPADQSTTVVRVPVCSPVQILKRSGEWTYCAAPGGSGWVQSSKVEAIVPQA